MKKSRLIYSKTLNLILLVSYLGIFAGSIFHFHSVDFVFYQEAKYSEAASGNFSLSLHSNNNCPVHQTFSNLHIFNPLPDKSSSENPNSLTLKITESSGRIIEFDFSFHQLRAPPLGFS